MCGIVATQNLEIAEMTFDSKGREDIYDWVFIILFSMLAQSLVTSWVWSLPWTKGSQNRGTCAKGVMAHGLPGASAPVGPGGEEVAGGKHTRAPVTPHLHSFPLEILKEFTCRQSHLMLKILSVKGCHPKHDWCPETVLWHFKGLHINYLTWLYPRSCEIAGWARVFLFH